MAQPRLYHELATLWPLISPPGDYAAEANVIRRLLRKHMKGIKRPEVLELGCGGGHTMIHLARHFDMMGVDLSPHMLECSQRLNPDIPHVQGDMRTVRLGRLFDAVIIHDAIDYMLSEDDLQQCFATASAHLKPAGLLLVAPTYLRENFTDNAQAGDSHSDSKTHVSYTSRVHAPDPADTIFQLTLTIEISRDSGNETIEDVHTCGLFDQPTWERLLNESGFDVVDRADIDWEGGNAVRFLARKA